MQEQNTKNATELQSQNERVARSLARDGYKVFPCDPATKRPMPGVKWRDVAATDPDRIAACWRKWPEAMPALPTGKANGISVVDLDMHGDKDGIAAYRERGFDPDDSSLIVRTAGGGLHLYFEHREGIRNSTDPAGIDVRGEGGYVIAPGAVSKAGVYRVEAGDMAFAHLLGFEPFPAALTRPESEPVDDQPEPGDYTPADLWPALAHISSDTDRDPWLEIVMAVHHATGGSKAGLALAQAWSARDYAAYDPKAVLSVWRSLGKKPGDRITVDTLFARAREGGWQAVTDDMLDDFFDDDPESDHPVLDDEALALLGELPEPLPDKDGVTAWTLDDCAAAASRPYVIKGLIGEGDVGCLVGAPGAGKSVLAPALAHAVAQGREIYGRKVKQGKVFYVAAEDQRGMMGRLTALRDAYGPTPDLVMLGGVSDLLNPEAGKKWSRHARNLAKRVQAERPRMVVIDTLAMSFPGLEENSAEGMGRVMAVAHALAKWGAAVLLIHHDTKMGDGLPRGHSLLNGALDVSIHVKAKSGGVVVGTLTKNRNGPCNVELAYRIDSAQVGVDMDGDPVTVPIWQECEPGQVQDGGAPMLNTRQREALDALEDAGKGDWVSRADWRSGIAAKPVFVALETPDSRRRAVNRAVNDLVERGFVEANERDNGVFRPFDEYRGLLDDL